MKKGLYSLVIASAVLGASSIAFAGAYGEAEQPEEIPAPAPAVVVPEPEPVRTMRKFSGFLTDVETTRGLRAEIGTVYAAEYHPANVGDVEATNTYLHISYGTELFEVGLYAPPYRYVKQNGIGEADDFGDMKLWGKVIPLRTEHFHLGAGLIVTFPTGDDGMGTAEYGFEPFITWGVIAGDAHIRSSVGYDVYTAHSKLDEDVYDNLDTNLAVLYPVAENVVLRAEATHNHFVYSHADPVNLFPGVDVYFPMGSVDLVLRPTLGIGITEAPDWQIGLGIAIEAPQI
ncbi:MAG: hypothetical protein LC667_05780 [Thioalkalivibrio sp.]|nr:hypothetical protein [Thioalkalivibrio sp.]